MDIEEEVLKLVRRRQLSLEQLRIVDAVQAMRENAFIDALIDYFTEMRNAE